MAEIDVSSYKQPPQKNPLEQLTQIGQASNAVGDLVVGNAMQGAIDPATGEIDQNKLLSVLRQSPIGAAKAVPTMDAIAKLKSAGFAADQAGLETFQKRMALTHHLFSGLASKDNPTMKDVNEVAAQALDPALNGDKYGITLPVVMNAVKGFRGLTPAQIKKKALEIQTQAAATAEILNQHSPRGQWINQGGQWTFVPAGTGAAPAVNTAVPNTLPPTTEEATPGGKRYLNAQPPVPGGGAVAPDGRPIVPKPVRTETIRSGGAAPSEAAARPVMSTLPPGYSEAATGIASGSAASANALTQANDTSMTRKGMLGNLENDLEKFTTGPGASYEKLAKAWVNRNIPVPKSWQDKGGILDVQKIASQEEFNKQAAMLAQSQFEAIGGTGTDAKFNSAFTTSPNEALSQLGNKGIIRLLKGNEDAIQAKNKAWQQWQEDGNGPQTYSQFSTKFNEKFDPRVFQFKYIEPKARQEYVDKMDPQDRARFLTDMTYARKNGWVSFDQPKAK